MYICTPIGRLSTRVVAEHCCAPSVERAGIHAVATYLVREQRMEQHDSLNELYAQPDILDEAG